MGSEKKPSTVAPANVEVQVALESAKDAKSASCASKIIEEEAQPKGHLVVFVCSDEFEIACGCAICYSVFVICLQTDAVDAPFFIQFSESLVTAFFLLEWILRVAAFGRKWFKGFQTLLDTFIVWCPGVVVVWIMQPLNIEENMSDLFKFFRIARMLRFVQLVRTFKHVAAFEDLWKLVRGLVSSGGTLLSAMSLIVFNLYVFAIFCCELIGFQEFSAEASDAAKEAQQRFKGISQSMLTLTRFMHGDDSQGIMDDLVEELPYIWIFLWLFTALSSFVLLNLVTAVIVQQAMDMSKGDEKELAIIRKREQDREMKELAEMFREIDEDGSGIVSIAEFEEALKDETILGKFMMLGLKKDQAMELFALLDTGGEGELDLSEFMQGMSQLKGVAKNKDLVMLVKGIKRLGKGITRMGESMGVHGLQDDDQEEPKLRERVVSLRNKLRERLQKSEDGLQRFSARMDKMAIQAEAAIRRIKEGGAPPSRKAEEFSRSKSKDQLSERKAKSPGKKERSKDREATKEDRDKESKEPKESKRREKEPKEGKEAKEPKEKETKEKDLKDSKGEEAEEPGGEREPREKSEKDPHEKREKKERKERRKKKKDDAEDAVDDPEA